jgi:uncharacterized protein (DUF305 family)
MYTKVKLLLTLAASMYIITSCNNNTATDADKTDTSSSSSMQSDTMNKKMSKLSDTMKMDNGLMASINPMMEKMNRMKMSGNFDMDFANMMIEHHQGAIDMSEQEINSGKDDKMKGMAQKIITSQKEEISKLQVMVKNMKPSKMKMGEGELEKLMSDMKSQMSNMQMTGNLDKDFTMMMTSHHESAVSMSKMELKNGMNAALKQMAQKGISEQTKEINEFKSWMAANK